MQKNTDFFRSFETENEIIIGNKHFSDGSKN